MTNSNKAQAKGRHKGKEPKASDSKPKEDQKTSKGALGSKNKRKFEKKMCPDCTRGFHPEDSCMKKTLNQLKALCVT